MTIRILATLALLGLMRSAGAGGLPLLEQIERPYELALGQLTLPKDTSGTVTVHECDSCRFSSHALTGATKFLLDGRAVPYADFLQAVTDLRLSSSALNQTVVNVYVDIATERVTRVAIRRPRR
jgi:hypothetical protein